MTRNEKALLIVGAFKGWKINSSLKKELGLMAEIDFSERKEWLTEEEETLLFLLDATNVFSPHLMSQSLPERFRSNEVKLNAACCGVGNFIFEDDEGEESLPIPHPVTITLTS